MTLARPVEHAIFPSFLQTHSVMRPGLDLPDPPAFERYLRYNALFYRGLVVADSDLNNNAIFHNAAQRKDGLFWTAIRTGFLRRAARTDYHGNLLTQREVSEGLRKSSPSRFDLIPAGYPADLDAAIPLAENEDPSLIWTLPNVNKVFGGKLLAMLKGAKSDPSRDATQQDLIDAMAAWVTEQLSGNTFFGAADIETQLQPPLDSAKRPAWEAVWPIVLDAHTGNIPLVFGGALAVTGLPEANDRMLPAGPESSAEERIIAALLYAGASRDQNVRLEVRRIDRQLPALNINLRRLDELSLEQVEDLREAAMPEEFLDRRFRAAGSATQMKIGADALRDAAVAFIERLAAAGIALTTEAQRTALRSDLWGPPTGNDGSETQIVAIVDSPERAVEYAMLHSIPFPGLGPHVLECDFTSLLSQVDQERARALYGTGIALHWIYKRPDFQVFELMGRAENFYSS